MASEFLGIFRVKMVAKNILLRYLETQGEAAFAM